MFVPPQTSLQRTLQTLIFGLTEKVFNIHDKHTETDIFTALFSGYFIGEATSVQVHRGGGGEWQRTVKNKLGP